MDPISVLLPVRNRAGQVGRQLEALADQDTSRTFEVVVADNGSTDDTVAVVRSLAGRFDHLEVVDAAAARGAAGARNLAASRASAPVLALCDSDDVVERSWLDHLVAPLDDRSGVVAGRVVGLAEGQPPPAVEEVAPMRPRGPLLHFRPFANTCNLAIRAADFARVGGFDGSYRWSEDVEFSWRAQSAGLAVLDAPDAVVFKYRREGTGPQWRQRYHWGQDHVRLYRQFRSAGMSRRPAAEVLGGYATLVARLALLWNAHHRDRFLSGSAQAAGHLTGSALNRAWYP